MLSKHRRRVHERGRNKVPAATERSGQLLLLSECTSVRHPESEEMMKRMISVRLGLTLLIATALLISVSGSALAGNYKAEYKRGSFLMWSKTVVDFVANGSSIQSAVPIQSCGSVFPNKANKLGVRTYKPSSKNWRYYSMFTLGAGTPSKLGDINIYTMHDTHTANIYSHGGWSIKSTIN
jgi:hypothetical protein